MKLVVGLGNPGKEYEKTRHNMGFMMLDSFLNYKEIPLDWKKKFNGLYIQSNINDEKVIFLKPQSYMNLSGGVVRKFMDYFDIDVSSLIVISDDLDLNVGNFKLKNKGSCGGHNGLRDIESKIGSSNYKRLKIGISNNKDIDTSIKLKYLKEIGTIIEKVHKTENNNFKLNLLSLLILLNKLSLYTL